MCCVVCGVGAHLIMTRDIACMADKALSMESAMCYKESQGQLLMGCLTDYV